MSESNTAVQNLFEEFPPVSTEEWEAVIANDLKGANYKKKLRWHTGEGIAPLPFYRREDLKKLARTTPISNKYRTWEIREAVYGSTIDEANESAQQSLNSGADALHISVRIMRDKNGLKLTGVRLQTPTDFAQLFENIPLNKTSLHLDAGILSPTLLGMLRQSLGGPSANIHGTVLYDPLAAMLLHGKKPAKSTLPESTKQFADSCYKNFPGILPLGIDARIYHNSGGTTIQELGFALGAASEYFAMLTEAGYSADEVAGMLHFTFAAGSNYFLEIAKFRAMRLLWQNLIEAYGVDPNTSPAYIHAETSQWNKTGYDPYTNMLRTTTEGMSAVLGGCDALTVLPFDASFRQPDAFSQRIAGNAQIIMREEAYLNKVQDPAAGSYYVEKLTDDIARKAWQLFQEVEECGGMFQAIEGGFVQSAIRKSQQKRDQGIATRRRIFVGSNQYPNPNERRAEDLSNTEEAIALKTTDRDIRGDDTYSIEKLGELFEEGATLGDVASLFLSALNPQIETLKLYRGPQAFEELRLATERNDKTPKVLNLPIGHPKMRKARSAFSNNFFGCMGYDIEDPIGFEEVSEAVEAIDEIQPEIAVLCSSDKEYEQLVPKLCEQLTGFEKRPLLVLTGYPEEQIEAYQKAGIDLFIHSNCNVLETLKEVQQKLGVIKN